jgi:hypothetical protein
MPDDLISIRMRLLGGRETASELDRVDRGLGSLDDTTARVSTTTSGADKTTSRFRSTLSGIGRTVAYSSIPVFGLLAYEVTKSVNAYREAAKVGDQTNAVIKSTGGAAKVSAKEVARLSETLSLKTGVDDEEIQSGANMLLTFKNIRNEVGLGNNVFDQSVEVLNDMSSAMGKDMKSSAIQLGKALNDPVAGMSALSRVGVQFDEATQKRIGRLVKQGKTLEAQKVILRELTSEFGGSAKAQHDAVDKLGVAWENLEEKLGEAVYPILKDVTQWLTKALRQAQKGKGPLIDIKEGFEDFGIAVKDTAEFLNDLIRPMRWILSHADDISNIVTGGMTGEFTVAEARAQGAAVRGLGQANDPEPGGGQTTSGGSGPQKVRRTPITAAPKASTASAGTGRGPRGPLVVQLVMKNGRVLAEHVVDEAEIAAAWG